MPFWSLDAVANLDEGESSFLLLDGSGALSNLGYECELGSPEVTVYRVGLGGVNWPLSNRLALLPAQTHQTSIAEMLWERLAHPA